MKSTKNTVPEYHKRLVEFIKMLQRENLMIGGAMTDVKGDRGLRPSQQEDPDMFVHMTNRDDNGIYITGAKAHQTGCINSHWIIAMPTMRLKSEDKDYAIIGAIPVDAPGITYIYGRQSCDTRSMEGGNIDAGNTMYFRPRSYDYLQGCFHSKTSDLHEWRI